MRFARFLPVAVLTVAGLGLAPAARATTIERVVAVVGDQAIFLSDMRHRARSFLAQIEQQVPSGAQRAAAESELYKQLLQRMVEERIEQLAADKAHLTVTSEEIDNGIGNVASQSNVTVEQVVAEAQKSAGLTPQEYRDEIRRQILEVKLLQLRVRGRVRVTESDIRSAYDKLLGIERRRLGYRAAWIVLRVPAGTSPAARADREDLAGRIAETARAGVHARGGTVKFTDLARSFSDDTPTRDIGGDIGWHKPGDLADVVENEAMRLDVGQISAPFVYKDAIVVLKVVERDPSQFPTFAQAKSSMTQRAYDEQMLKERKQWLDEQRRLLYVDIRL